MASSLFLLVDDIATILDDVALLSKVAAKKTAGVLGDDLALNAQQVAGVTAERELPVAFAVARGSFINKAILVPSALVISSFAHWAVTPLLMVGGAYLCFEGFEKLVHKYLISATEQSAERASRLASMSDLAVDLVALEKEKIKGSVRTDFILSAEIIFITLGAVQGSPFITQVTVLSGIAIIMTIGVYGLVAGIVKLDDVGPFLTQRPGTNVIPRFEYRLGRAILSLAPWLMRGLSVAGTIAMFLVGGSILTHGTKSLQQLVEQFTSQMEGVLAVVLPLLINAVVGMAAGALVLAVVTVAKRFRRRG